MKNSKYKRIKRLKKKQIWPSALGLAIISIAFTIGLAILIEMGLYDVFKRKVIASTNEVNVIVDIIKAYDYDEESMQEQIINYIDETLEAEAVWVSDIEDNKIWANSDKVPNVEDVIDIEFIATNSVQIVIPKDTTSISINIDGDIVFHDNFLYKISILDIIQQGIDENKEIFRAKVWTVNEVDDLKVYVLQDVVIYSQDCYMLVVSVLLFIAMMAIFILYYLISFISIIINIRKISKILYTDVVTGGRNWLYYEKKGNKLLKSRFKPRDYAVIHFKMRKFRSFCTCFGVEEGNALVEQLYNVMKKQIERKELLVYKDNASFCLLLTYIDEQQLSERIEAMIVSLNEVLSNMKLYFAAGIYVVNKEDKDIEQLYSNAVLACDMLGEEAENKILFYDIEMNKRRLWERKVEDDMDAALLNHEFQVYLQPKISTKNEELAGAEALVRWIHPTEGFIPPNKFIPIFEHNGFILKLDDYMLEEVARQQAEWIEQGKNIVPISVNVSRAHFTREGLAEHICSVVDKYEVPHQFIELELTESAFFDDKEILINTVKKLRESGFIVSMDDFGAGYSSLNSLKELQLDVLKLDADFFRGVDAVERGMLIVSEVIDLAKKLNMKIVAEGIENREQVDFLTEQECDLIQGYFYAKPMLVSEFEEKYREISGTQYNV